MRILIVDDDKKRREKLVEFISSNVPYGIEKLDTSENIDDAKQSLKTIYYDMLILDVVLPKRGSNSASASNGLALLDQVSRGRVLKKPAKIIGITAYNDDIKSYREQFESACSVVIEAQSNQREWKEKISSHISYSISARASKTVSENSIEVITVHGIRTFGDWQNRLKKCVDLITEGVSFQSYKYGYFSPFAFAIPLARNREVKKLGTKLKPVIQNSKAKHLIIFCHSFGTYLVVHALNEITNELSHFDKITLVLSGSVLDSSYNWSTIEKNPKICIINECGDSDLILWLSNIFIIGCGMAGKIGFSGFNNNRFSNRFYKGGHSLYFKGDDFMKARWIPIITNEDYQIATTDDRTPNIIMHGIGDQLVRFLGKIKSTTYISAAILSAYLIIVNLTQT